MGPVLEALEGLAESSIKAYNSLYDEPNSHHCYAQLEVSFTHNFVCVSVCVCVYVGGWVGGGCLSSASSQDESSALHNGNCIAPFSASTQTLWTLSSVVVVDCL